MVAAKAYTQLSSNRAPAAVARVIDRATNQAEYLKARYVGSTAELNQLKSDWADNDESADFPPATHP